MAVLRPSTMPPRTFPRTARLSAPTLAGMVRRHGSGLHPAGAGRAKFKVTGAPSRDRLKAAGATTSAREASFQRAAEHRMRRMASRQRIGGLTLRLITPAEPLYRASAEAVARALPAGLREPWWAFAWPGSFALADYLRQRPSAVRGKRVLDFGSGCGISALAAVRAGAAEVLANDIDEYALHATRWNARCTFGSGRLLGRLRYSAEDLLLGTASGGQATPPHDVLLIGDMCYDCEMAAAVRRWVVSLLTPPPAHLYGARRFRPPEVLIGDPGRSGFKSAFPSFAATGAGDGGGDGSLRMTAVHKSTLPKLVADASNGLRVGTVWRVSLAS
eukprot:SAG22_NODE_1072_length_5706_cov_10.864455_2_plen_331_part_00